MWTDWKGSRKRHKDKRLGSLPQEKRLRKLDLFSFDNRSPSRDLMTMVQYLKSGFREGGDSLLTVSHMEKTRGNRYKLLLERFHLES